MVSGSRSSLKLEPQLALPGLSNLDDVLGDLAQAGIEERGAIYTRREVVDFILDLVGYTADQPLHEHRILEPSFGGGDFLFPILDRLLSAWQAAGRPGAAVATLKDAVRGVELHRATFEATSEKLDALLAERGLSEIERRALGAAWLRQGDFLLQDDLGAFTHVVGNPPYVRQEAVPDPLMAEYRRRYATIYDRADLYVPFIEHALSILRPSGALGFICADRWMKNRYGGPLRRLVADEHHLRVHVDMVGTQPFLTDVTAYPAIFVIAREGSGPTRIARRPDIKAPALSRLAVDLTAQESRDGVVEATVVDGDEPWILEGFSQLAIVRRLEQELPTIEEAGCRVGIGVATGADQVYVAPYDELDVEPERKLPLVMTRDILTGHVEWRGRGVLNPFEPDGRLAQLDAYPRFARYLERHGAALRARHVAAKNPRAWYRTIDRIYPELTTKPKLLIPDIKGEAHIVYEEGRLYPHHNLYFITSDTWDLQALQAVLLSGIARLFVATYSTRMRGGYLRFQAQYLRRIRVPRWDDVPRSVRDELHEAGARGDKAACDAAVFHLYRLTERERLALVGGEG